MGAALSYIEITLGTLLRPVRTHDSGLLTRSPAFANISPTIPVSSSLGPSGTRLSKDTHSQWALDGTTGAHPDLSWTAPPGKEKLVKEYILLCEDPDVPIPGFCPHHSIFYAIPPTHTAVSKADLELVDNDKKAGKHVVKNGWQFVPNLRGTQYMGPRPPLGHGPHRYIYTVVALGEKLDLGGVASKKAIANDCVGKVIGWGEWVGNYENLWEDH